MTALRALRDDRPRPEPAPWDVDDIDPVRVASVEHIRASMPGHVVLGAGRYYGLYCAPFQVQNLDTLRVGHIESTADSKTADVGRLPGLERLEHAANALPEGDLHRRAYSEAVRLLDILRATSIPNLPAPDIGVSEDGVSLGWTKDDQIVLVSVEGDGEAAYAYHVGNRFQPGNEVFVLDREQLPDDLRDYLQGMYA
jgi:hypothetical protein